MKNKRRLNLLQILYFGCILFLNSCSQQSNQNPEALEEISSKLDVENVLIGEQIWMKYDLQSETFQNGDSILLVKTLEEWISACDLKQPACYKHITKTDDSIYFRFLYNWYTVIDSRNIAPQGWSVSNDIDWQKLERYLGMSRFESNSTKNGRGNKAEVGRKLKANYQWQNLDNSNNQSGFEALPTGYFNPLFGSYTAETEGYWWTSTEKDNLTSWGRILFNGHISVVRLSHTKSSGYSIRCIKDL